MAKFIQRLNIMHVRRVTREGDSPEKDITDNMAAAVSSTVAAPAWLRTGPSAQGPSTVRSAGPAAAVAAAAAMAAVLAAAKGLRGGMPTAYAAAPPVGGRRASMLYAPTGQDSRRVPRGWADGGPPPRGGMPSKLWRRGGDQLIGPAL